MLIWGIIAGVTIIGIIVAHLVPAEDYMTGVTTSDGHGGSTTYTDSGTPPPPPPPPVIIIKGWRQLPSRGIVGLRDGRVQGHATLTDYTDFDTYPDGAILRLVNETGADVTVNGLCIIGKPVYCHKDAYVWERRDDESIESNGESSLEISNSYMIDPAQIEDLGDYLQKAFDARPVYGLSIPGCHYEYEVGDVWHLELDYTIQGQPSECELIDTDVEIESVAFSRNVGGIGETRLVCMPPMGAWTKTTSRRAWLISAGMAQWLNNRGNEVLVASSEYTGQADYYCDGTADDVEIQAAIDAMVEQGGGEIHLTNGQFNLAASINVGANVFINGSKETVLSSTALFHPITVTGAGSTIESIKIENTLYDSVSISAADFTMSKCTVDRYIITAGANTNINRCNIAAFDNGITVNSAGCLVANNIFTMAVATASYVVAISIQAACTVTGNVFNEYSNNAPLRAIDIHNAGDNSVIANNLILGVVCNHDTEISYGIHIGGGADNCVISSNQITGITNSGAAQGYGIRNAADRTNIIGNTVLGCKTNYSEAGTNTSATGNITA